MGRLDASIYWKLAKKFLQSLLRLVLSASKSSDTSSYGAVSRPSLPALPVLVTVLQQLLRKGYRPFLISSIT